MLIYSMSLTDVFFSVVCIYMYIDMHTYIKR